MSFMDEFQKALNEDSKTTKKTSQENAVKKVAEQYKKKSFKRFEPGDIGPVLVRTQDRLTIGPVKEKENKIDLFQKGVFEDGYQVGDITKSILGTAGDAGLNVAKGILGLGEGLVDLVDYGIAAGADALGHDKWADDLRKVTSESLVDKATKGADEFLAPYSVLGRTSKGILQGVGQVGGIIGSGGLAAASGLGVAGTTLATSGMMGLSSAGSGMGEALMRGATAEEAAKYGAIAGASDFVTNLIFGGLGKAVNAIGISRGLTNIDDVLAKALTDKVKSQITKNLIQFGVKSGAEGLEEVLSGFIQAAGKKATYMSEKDFKDILEDENLLEQFIVGSFTSGMIQSGFVPGTKKGSLIEANKNESDFLTGLTKNEKIVMDILYKERIAEAEKNGKISGKDKSNIYDEIIEAMEKGEISTDKIEEILGGDSYKAYKDAADNHAVLKKELDELRQMKKGDMNDIQQDRLAELKGMKLDDTSNRDSLKFKLGSEVSELVKGDRLAESYNQKAQRGKGFSVDLNKVDKKQRHIYQKAMDSKVVNNSTRAHEFVGLVARISADKGIDFDFTNNQKLKDSGLAIGNAHISGYINEAGVTINMQSPNALNAVVGHEVAHVLEGTELYSEMQNLLFEYAKPKGEYLPRYKALKERYKEAYKDLSPEEFEAKIDQEVTADLVGDLLFTDKEFINNLYSGNRTVFDKIYDEIKYLCKVVTAKSKEARQLEQIKKKFEDAYHADSKAQKDTADGGVKYSIGETTDGRSVAIVDNDILKGIDTSTWDKETKKAAKKAASNALKNFSGGIEVRDMKLEVTKTSRDEYTRSQYSEMLARTNPEAYLDKMRASDNLDDIVHVTTGWAKDGGIKHERSDFVDFAHGKTLIMSGDRTYSAEVIVGLRENGEAVFYDVVDIVPDDFDMKKSEPSTAVASNESLNAIQESSDNRIIPQNSSKSSETGSQGFTQADIAPVRKYGNYNIMSEDVYFDPTKKNIAPVAQKADIAPVYKPSQNAPKTRRDIAPVPVKKKKQGIISKLVNRTVDKGMVFENLSLKSGNMELQSKWDYALPSKAEARAQWFMRNGKNGSASLDSVRKKVEASGKTEAFQDYMRHWRNVDGMTLRERFGMDNKPVFGTSVSADISRKRIAEYEKQNPEFKEFSEDLYSYFAEERRMMVESGLITEEQAKHMEEMYPHYIPLHREADELLGPVQSKNLGVNSPIKSATGGNRPLQPMFDTIAQHTIQTFKAVARNDFGVELKNTIQTTTKADATDADEIFDSIENQNNLLGAGSDGSGYTFSVYENGQKVTFEITEAMHDALKPTDGLLGERIKPLTKLNDIRRNLITSWSTVFALYRNPAKDIQDVMINSQHPVKTYMNVPNAIKELATNGKWAMEYLENGGEQNTYYDNRKGTFTREEPMWRRIIGFPVRGLEAAGEFIERVPRLAEYIASRESGRSVQRSMLDAARVTTNFAAGGDFTKFLNSHGFTFLNAGVQGFSQNVRNFREAKMNGFKGYVQLAAKFTVAGLSAGIFNGLFWDEEDDEDYEELSDYVKQNYYVVAKTSDGKFVRIPKGRMAAVIQDGMEQMEHLVTGDDEADFESFFKLVMDNLAPGNPLDNNILAPIAQVLNNKTWYDDDLVPSRLADLPAAEQFDESTDSLSKWLGEKMDISPYKINYLIDQYSGGLGDVFLPMMTPEAESGDNSFLGNLKAPWKKEWTTDSVLNNKYPSEFYDLRDELEVISNGKKATDEDKLKNLYMSSVGWQMSDLYAEKREIQNSDLPDDQKFEAVREVQDEINTIAENALKNYGKVKIDGLYATVGNKRFDYSEYKGQWYEIEGDYLEKEQKAVNRYGITPSEYWNDTDLYYHADWYFDNQYADPQLENVAKLVFGGKEFAPYAAELSQIKADKDNNGNSISGSKKAKMFAYIDSLNIPGIEKAIMRKMNYNSEDKHNSDILKYLNGRSDLTYEEKRQVLEGLGATVDDQGRVRW